MTAAVLALAIFAVYCVVAWATVMELALRDRIGLAVALGAFWVLMPDFVLPALT